MPPVRYDLSITHLRAVRDARSYAFGNHAHRQPLQLRQNVTPEIRAESLARLREGWSRLYEVGVDEALRFTCNGVVAGTRFIVTFIPARLEAALAREGLWPHIVDLSEFEKSGGSAFCMKTFVE